MNYLKQVKKIRSDLHTNARNSLNGIFKQFRDELKGHYLLQKLGTLRAVGAVSKQKRTDILIILATVLEDDNARASFHLNWQRSDIISTQMNNSALLILRRACCT